MMFGLALLIALIVLWRVRRARRSRVLAGLDAGKPAFHIEPPHRRQERASRGVL